MRNGRFGKKVLPFWLLFGSGALQRRGDREGTRRWHRHANITAGPTLATHFLCF